MKKYEGLRWFVEFILLLIPLAVSGAVCLILIAAISVIRPRKPSPIPAPFSPSATADRSHIRSPS